MRKELAAEGEETMLPISQYNNCSQEEAADLARNWRMALDSLKRLLQGIQAHQEAP